MKTLKTKTSALCCLAAMGMLASAGSAFGQCSSQKLLSSDRIGLDLFASSVAMSAVGGNPAAAFGARWDDTAAGVAAGSVYTFQKSGAAWGQVGHVFASDGAASDYFGTSIGYAEPYMIVGAPGNGTGGAAYIFEHSGLSWPQKSKIVIGGPLAGDGAGTSVAIEATSGGWALVGAPNRGVDVSANSGVSDPVAGVVLLCQRQANGTWTAVDTWPTRYSIYAGTYTNEAFGTAVAMAGDLAVCGAPMGENINWPTDHGYIYVYRRASATNTWGYEQRLVSNNAETGDRYGAAVATDGTSIAIGAPGDDATAAQLPEIGSAKSDSGCVYVQRYISGAWNIDGQVFASDASNSAQFGSSVAISGDRLIVGAAGAKKSYVFKRMSAGHWVQIAQYNDPDTAAGGSFSSGGVAMYGDQMIIADPQDDDAAMTNQGAAYVYTMPGASTGSDLCGAATAIQSGEYSGCTNNAGLDATTTCGFGGTGFGPDVWFSWTPNCSGNVIIDTFGSSFDTVLSIHSSCPGGGGSNTITCNDDGFSLPSRDSLVTFDYVAGTSYLIRVAGYGGAKGDFNLRVVEYQHPANDACASSKRVYNGPNFFKNCKATIDGPLDDAGCSNDNNQGADVWFKYTATSTGPLTVNTCGVNFDTVLMVYTTSCPQFNSQAIACSDDSTVCGGFSLQSSATFNATSGTTYTIRVGGYEPPTNTDTRVGEGNLNVLPACPCDFNGGGLAVQDIFDFINAWLAGSPAADFNGDGLQVQDIFDFLNCWFAGCF